MAPPSALSVVALLEKVLSVMVADELPGPI